MGTHSCDGTQIKLYLPLFKKNQPFKWRRCVKFYSDKGRTLIISLCWLWDADAKLAAIGIDAHHAAVGWRAGERRDLAGIPGDTVQGFRDVRGSLQNDVLQNGRLGGEHFYAAQRFRLNRV